METTFQLEDENGRVFNARRVPGPRRRVTMLSSTEHEYMETLPSFELVDGTPLNQLDDDSFKNVRTEATLRRVTTATTT